MNYQNNLESLRDELQAALSALKGTHFAQYDVHTHATFLTVEAYGTSIDICAEFEVRISGRDLIDEKGDLYKQANLRLEVRAQPWTAKSPIELGCIQELVNKTSLALLDLREAFGSHDVYVLVLSKEDQGKVAKRASTAELTLEVQEAVQFMRLGSSRSVISQCLPLARKAKILPDTYAIHLGSRTYTVVVDEKKNLDITRIE